MIVPDTNILARYLLDDEPAQADRAQRLLATAPALTLPVTVLLELVWVLESCDCSRAEVAAALRHLLGLPNLYPHNEEAVFRAIQWYGQGLDFADALHLALSGAGDKLATFDRAFIRKAARVGAFPAVIPCP